MASSGGRNDDPGYAMRKNACGETNDKGEPTLVARRTRNLLDDWGMVDHGDS